jgi:hypothetical protein
MVVIAYGSFDIQANPNKYSLSLPNVFNISLDLFYVFWLWIILYVPIFPMMYKHMLVQRKKYLYAVKGHSKKN